MLLLGQPEMNFFLLEGTCEDMSATALFLQLIFPESYVFSQP